MIEPTEVDSNPTMPSLLDLNRIGNNKGKNVLYYYDDIDVKVQVQIMYIYQVEKGRKKIFLY